METLQFLCKNVSIGVRQRQQRTPFILSLTLHLQKCCGLEIDIKYYTLNAHFAVSEEYTFLNDSMKDVFPLTKDDEFSPNKKFT